MTTKNILPINERKIRAQMILKGIRQTDIARELKLTPQSVHKVVRGIPCSNRIRAEIATRLGKSVSQLWPAKRRGALNIRKNI